VTSSASTADGQTADAAAEIARLLNEAIGEARDMDRGEAPPPPDASPDAAMAPGRPEATIRSILRDDQKLDAECSASGVGGGAD
jgi:hypothetical protein